MIGGAPWRGEGRHRLPGRAIEVEWESPGGGLANWFEVGAIGVVCRAGSFQRSRPPRFALVCFGLESRVDVADVELFSSQDGAVTCAGVVFFGAWA